MSAIEGEVLDSGSVIGHYPCVASEVKGKKDCNSSDAMAVYEHEGVDGNVWYDAYCYSCNQVIAKADLYQTSVAVELGVSEGEIKERKPFVKASKKERITKEEIKEVLSHGYKGLNYRGIKDEFRQFYGHTIKVVNETPIAEWYPETKDGKLTGYKSRHFPKNFGYDNKGVTGVKSDLSGQVKFKDKNFRDILVVGGECFTEDTELMTQVGWVSVKDIVADKTLKVMQVSSEGKGFLVYPIDYTEKYYQDDLVHYENKFMSSLTTKNHNLVAINSKGYYKFKAIDGVRSKPHKTPLCVKYTQGVGVEFTNDQLALIIAVAADSKVDTYKNGTVKAHFLFKKERKKQRLVGLLKRLGITYTSYPQKKEGRDSFNFALPKWYSHKGLPISMLYQFSEDQRLFILEEITHWDGNAVKGRNSTEFSSKSYEEASFIRDLAKISNIHASISPRANEFGSWYSVKINWGKSDTSWQSLQDTKKIIPYSGKVYCVTVPTGMLLIKHNEKVSVSGNCDKASAYQMWVEYQRSKAKKKNTDTDEYDYMPVVSGTTGESSLISQIRENYDFICSAENIYIGLDNDQAGISAMEAICGILPKDKVKIVKWSKKDPNSYIHNPEGKDYSKQFISDFFAAKEYEDSGIFSSSGLMPHIKEALKLDRVPLPSYMAGLQDMTKGSGLIKNRLYNLIGITSCGKSTHVNAMVHHFAFLPTEKCAVISLEATKGEYGIDILSLHLERNLYWEEADNVVEYLDSPSVQQKANDLFVDEYGESRFYVVDDRKGTVASLEKLCETLKNKYGVTLIVIDVLTDLLRVTTNEEQARHLNWQSNFVKGGVTIINVLHTRKLAPSNGMCPVKATEYDALGSSIFVQKAAGNIVINRNKEAPEEDWIEKNTTYVSVPKMRQGKTGETTPWIYDPETRKSYDRTQFFKDHPEKLPSGYDLTVSSFDKAYWEDASSSRKPTSLPQEGQIDFMDQFPIK